MCLFRFGGLIDQNEKKPPLHVFYFVGVKCEYKFPLFCIQINLNQIQYNKMCDIICSYVKDGKKVNNHTLSWIEMLLSFQFIQFLQSSSLSH